MNDVYTFAVLMSVFLMKHWVADFVLQTPYMLQKGDAHGWVFPLMAHVGVHLIGSAPIILIVHWKYGWLLLMEGVIHFTVDRIKASPFMWGRYVPSDKAFWITLGFDQLVHNITYVVMALFLLKRIV